MNESHSSAQALFATRVHMLLAADQDWSTRRAFTIARERYGLDELALALHVSPRELAAFGATGAPAAPGDVQQRLLQFVGAPVDPAELSTPKRSADEAAENGEDVPDESTADVAPMPESGLSEVDPDHGEEDIRGAGAAQAHVPSPSNDDGEVSRADAPADGGEASHQEASEPVEADAADDNDLLPEEPSDLPPPPPAETALGPDEAGSPSRMRILIDAAQRYAAALQRREKWWRAFFIVTMATLASAAVLVWFIDDARAIALLATACAISAAASTIVAARERAGDVEALQLLLAALDAEPTNDPR